MLKSQKIGNELYQNLGKLFYAITIADHKIHPKEIDKLRIFIHKYWLNINNIEDEYGENAVFQIETVFDWLREECYKADDCFNAFSDFYKERLDLFSEEIKILILDTAHAIANSFSGKNKSELILLGKLQLLFQNKIP